MLTYCILEKSQTIRFRYQRHSFGLANAVFMPNKGFTSLAKPGALSFEAGQLSFLVTALYGLNLLQMGGLYYHYTIIRRYVVRIIIWLFVTST